jgi:hypothetical protein
VIQDIKADFSFTSQFHHGTGSKILLIDPKVQSEKPDFMELLASNHGTKYRSIKADNLLKNSRRRLVLGRLQ